MTLECLDESVHKIAQKDAIASTALLSMSNSKKKAATARQAPHLQKDANLYWTRCLPHAQKSNQLPCGCLAAAKLVCSLVHCRHPVVARVGITSSIAMIAYSL